MEGDKNMYINMFSKEGGASPRAYQSTDHLYMMHTTRYPKIDNRKTIDGMKFATISSFEP